MATTETKTVFVIKNKDDFFLEFQPYSGLRTWVAEYSERCDFANQNAATLYCRSLIADAKVHGLDFEYDVFKYNNNITDMDVTIPDNQLKSYGLPEAGTTETVASESDAK